MSVFLPDIAKHPCVRHIAAYENGCGLAYRVILKPGWRVLISQNEFAHAFVAVSMKELSESLRRAQPCLCSTCCERGLPSVG